MSAATTRSFHFPSGRSMALPIVAAGLLALAPVHLAGLFKQWQAAEAQQAPAAAPAPAPAARGSGVVARMQSSTATEQVPSGPQIARPADGKLLEELNRRTAELDRREHDLQTWATQIAVAERMARSQLAELARMRSEIEKVVDHETTASEADLAVLVGLYSNMKPTQAAAVLGRLSAPKAAAILEKLDIHSAGPALAAMDPEVAVAITEELTHRHATFRQ